MERYRATLKKRLYGIGLYAAALTVLVCLGLLRPAGGDSEEVRAFMSGFNAGLLAVAVVMLALGIRRYYAALRDERKLRALYIEEHDERLLAIRTRIGGTGMQIILFGLLLATIAAGFVSQTVFFTLLGALLFSAAVKAVLKIYYTKKLG